MAARPAGIDQDVAAGTVTSMADQHPLASLLRTALISPTPLSVAATRAILAHALTDLPANVAAIVYSRAELNADQANQLWNKYGQPKRGAGAKGDETAAWEVRRLLRAESHPELISANTVASWTPAFARSVARTLWCLPNSQRNPPNILEALMMRPELVIATYAAMSSPTHPEARNVVDRIGKLSARQWPGPYTGGETLSHPKTVELLSAVKSISSAASPDELANYAAATWTSPAALSKLSVRALNSHGAERVMRAWLLPALADCANDGAAVISVAGASMSLVENLNVNAAYELSRAWTSSGLLTRVDHVRLDEMERRFAAAGASLTRHVLEETARPLRDLEYEHLDELFTAVESAAATNNAIWDMLEATLGRTPPFAGTFGQLLDALTAVNAEPSSAAQGPAGQLATPELCGTTSPTAGTQISATK